MLINAKFIFKRPSFLTLLSLLRVFKWINLKLVLYLTGLNQLLSAILDHFSNFITIIDVLSKIFLNLPSFLLVSLRKIFFLINYQLINQLLTA